MTVMDYIQSGVEKVLKPKRGGLGSMGPGIGSSTGVAQFQDGVCIFSHHMLNLFPLPIFWCILVHS